MATAHGFAKIESLALHFVIILEFRKIYSSQKEKLKVKEKRKDIPI